MDKSGLFDRALSSAVRIQPGYSLFAFIYRCKFYFESAFAESCFIRADGFEHHFF